ncbi:hypothetical protein [Croceitalea rosinachiae]|uniref:Uncharacterized protein n=1 Tax=Croceitalea rosinachiae TaxID=3075596 RepID=A0ABU3A8V5_9FLAO|nr:hypothetical protein [Croceitalea sp. F388]MDT0606604.1 hypothetical protein [Croceitalea sp. F388]
MSELVRSGVIGIITVMLLLIGAHFADEMEETEIERSLNIKKKTVKVDAVVDSKTSENIDNKNSEAAL